MSANRTADSKTTTQSFTTPATRMVRALVWEITRKTERLSAKVQSELSASTTGGKFHVPWASIFGFSRKIHGMKRQRALHRKPNFDSEGEKFSGFKRRNCFFFLITNLESKYYLPAGTNIVHDRYRVQFKTLPFDQNLHEDKP